MVFVWTILGSVLLAFVIAYFCLIINGISNTIKWKAEINKLKYERLLIKTRLQWGRYWRERLKELR